MIMIKYNANETKVVIGDNIKFSDTDIYILDGEHIVSSVRKTSVEEVSVIQTPIITAILYPVL